MLARVVARIRARIPERAARFLRAPAVLGCLFWALVVGIAWAADCLLVGEISGPVPNQRFGFSLASIRDINGDGASELVVGAPGFVTPGGSIPGAVYVFSGAGLSPLYSIESTDAELFGAAVHGVGDLDGDGFDDILVGAPLADATSGGFQMVDAGRVYVFSGLSGGFIDLRDGASTSARFGTSLAVLPATAIMDDDVPDFIVGAPGDAGTVPAFTSTGAVYVYSGRTRTPLWVLGGDAESDRFGASIDAWTTGPGRFYLAVGAPDADAASDDVFQDTGRAYVYTGPPVQLLYTFNGLNEGDHFGSAVAGGGDLDEDGVHDLVVTAPNAGDPVNPNVGRMYAFSGRDGHLLYERSGFFPGEMFGVAARITADQTGDACSDVIVGAASPGGGTFGMPGAAYVFSGPTGDTLCRVQGFSPDELFGQRVLAFQDLNNDGRPEFFVSAPQASRGPVPTGAVRMFSVVPGPPLGAVTGVSAESSSEVMRLTWDQASTTCSGFDYAVYGGSLLNPGDAVTDYQALACGTDGATEWTSPLPAAFARGTALYFIPVPLGTNEEGSYGQGTGGTPHKPAKRPCRVFFNPAPCPP